MPGKLPLNCSAKGGGRIAVTLTFVMQNAEGRPRKAAGEYAVRCAEFRGQARLSDIKKSPSEANIEAKPAPTAPALAAAASADSR